MLQTYQIINHRIRPQEWARDTFDVNFSAVGSVEELWDSAKVMILTGCHEGER